MKAVVAVSEIAAQGIDVKIEWGIVMNTDMRQIEYWLHGASPPFRFQRRILFSCTFHTTPLRKIAALDRLFVSRLREFCDYWRHCFVLFEIIFSRLIIAMCSLNVDCLREQDVVVFALLDALHSIVA